MRKGTLWRNCPDLCDLTHIGRRLRVNAGLFTRRLLSHIHLLLEMWLLGMRVISNNVGLVKIITIIIIGYTVPGTTPQRHSFSIFSRFWNYLRDFPPMWMRNNSTTHQQDCFFSQWNQEDFSILILNLLRRFKIFKRNIHRYTSQSSFLVLKIGTLVVWPAVTLSAKRHALLINTTPNTTCTRPVYRRYFD